MSRIGNKPVPIPAGVKVSIDGRQVAVEGGKGKLTMELPPLTGASLKENTVCVTRTGDAKRCKAMHGLARSLIKNMVEGVSKGYKKQLEIIGVGYRAQVSGQKMTLALGLSHPVIYEVPGAVKVAVAENTKITLESVDKQLVGEVAATIRRFKKPEPYKGKGIRYLGEHITIKEGKTVG